MKFLKEQHDLLFRVINEKSLLDEERNSFFVQRNADITRIKEEAQKLDSKIIEVYFLIFLILKSFLKCTF